MIMIMNHEAEEALAVRGGRVKKATKAVERQRDEALTNPEIEYTGHRKNPKMKVFENRGIDRRIDRWTENAESGPNNYPNIRHRGFFFPLHHDKALIKNLRVT